MSQTKNAQSYISGLNMVAHPEGGYYKEIFRSTESIDCNALPERFTQDRCFCTAIYYLLQHHDISHLHKIDSDEIWFFLDGDPLPVHVISDTGEWKTIVLGRDISNGEQLFTVIPHGVWFCAGPASNGNYSIASCVVAPAFEFTGFQLARREALITLYPHLRLFIEQYTKA